MDVRIFKEASCCIQHYIMLYEGRTSCFIQNTIKHHAQWFYNYAPEYTMLMTVLSSKNHLLKRSWKQKKF